MKNNLTEMGFFIEKAEISIETAEGRDNFLASLKFKKPDKYLVSLKSRTGIEAARIYLSGDSLLINDRINRVVYKGSQQSLQRNYGISATLLPVILGDFIKGISADSISDCRDGQMVTGSVLGGMKITYRIDCRMNKVIEAIPESSIGKQGIDMKFGDFFMEGATVIPGNIIVKDQKKGSSIEIKIGNIEIPWNGDIEFIPGNNYEIQQLP
jgi:hypothetical protein